MKMFKREKLIAELRDSPRFVTFTKSDGTERVMRCTLEKSVVPHTEEDYNNLPGDTVIAWDLDKKGWRQFNVNTVKNVSKVA